MARSELTKVEPNEAEAHAPTPRASPRRGQQAAGGEAQQPAAEGAAAEDGLAQPARAAHERKRKLPMKPNAPVCGRQKATHTKAASKVAPQKQIEEFPGQSLAVVPTTNDYIFCQACKKRYLNKWSSIDAHCKKARGYETNLAAWLRRTEDDTELKETLLAYYTTNPDEAANTKDPDEMVYRYRTTEGFHSSTPNPRGVRMVTTPKALGSLHVAATLPQ